MPVDDEAKHGEARRAAAYLRETPIELAKQRDRSEEQLRQIERHVAAKGWKLVHVFNDMRRPPGSAPALESALEQAASLDKLVTCSLERLGRGPRAINRLLERLETAGVDLVCLDEGVDTGTEAGQLARKMLALVVRWTPPGVRSGWDRSNLGRHGFSPATMIDVGAARGTPPLLEAFPNAYHVLIEPLSEYSPELERVLERYHGEYVQTAVGGEEGKATMFIDTAMEMSSVLKPNRPRPSTGEREVPVKTLDRLMEEREWERPSASSSTSDRAAPLGRL